MSRYSVLINRKFKWCCIDYFTFLEKWAPQDVDKKISHNTGAYNSHNAIHYATALQQTDIPNEKSKDHLW